MGRGATDDSLLNRVREVRLTRGLSQKQLADRAGITRQAVNGIEMRRYTPNASVALRLAQALDSRVEDLFFLPLIGRDRPVLTSGEAMEDGHRVALARVGDVLVAHPLTGMRSIVEGFQPADAIASSDGASVSMLAPPDAPGKTAVLLGCDPSLTVLVSWVARSLPRGRLLWLHASSQSALDALPRGLAHVAGSHLPGGGPEANVAPARRAFGREGGLVVTYAAWEQGLIVAPGNPKTLRSAADLARSGVRIVNREPGSGSRKLLDELMTRDRVAPADVPGYASVVPSHTAVARAVAAGTSDAGIGLEAVSRSFGLDFVPLTEVRFDLVIPHNHASHFVVQAMLEVLQGARLRMDLAALPGYGTSGTGNIVATIPAAA
jgi:molybdate-binding protein/DNA-binding XRE family transcriptional regulator